MAAELERSADRARGRGGWGSSAAFLERAAALTPDEDHRARRMLAAAENRLAAGEAPAARAPLSLAAPRLADGLARATARRLEGQSLYAAGQMPEATSVLLDAARMLQPSETRLTRDTLLDAFVAAQFSAQSGAGMAEFLRAVRSAPTADSRATVADLLLDGFAAMGERRYQAGAALLRRAIAPLAAGLPIPDDALPHLMAVGQAANLLYDDSARYQMEKRWVAELRDRGAIAALVPALGIQLSVQVQEGRFADAEATLADGRALSEATGYRAYLGPLAWQELWALARRGREPDARSLAARLLREYAGRDRQDGHGGFRGPGPSRAARHRRAGPPAQPRDPGGAHGAGGADRPAGRRAPVQPGDRRPAVHQRQNRRVPLAQGLPQARRHQPRTARPDIPGSQTDTRLAGLTIGLPCQETPTHPPRTGSQLFQRPSPMIAARCGWTASHAATARTRHRCDHRHQ